MNTLHGFCIGGHAIPPGEYYYTINPAGGYGRAEVLCCEVCIKKPEYEGLRQRMVDAGAKELQP